MTCLIIVFKNLFFARIIVTMIEFGGHGKRVIFKLKAFSSFSFFSFASNRRSTYCTSVDCHSLSRSPYSSALRALSTVLREGGPTSLYKGLVPAIFSCTQGGVQVVQIYTC